MNQIDTILTSGLQDAAELETSQNVGGDADWNALFGSGYVLVTAN